MHPRWAHMFKESFSNVAAYFIFADFIDVLTPALGIGQNFIVSHRFLKLAGHRLTIDL